MFVLGVRFVELVLMLGYVVNIVLVVGLCSWLWL